MIHKNFIPHPGVTYKYDYTQILTDIADGRLPLLPTIRYLVLNDLFFIVRWIMGIKTANKKFVVDACRMVEEGPDDYTLDVWAREHFKSTIITIAETVQYHLKYPDRCTGIFSYKKPAAEDFLKSIKEIFEQDLLKACFPDRLYDRPDTESPTWSLQRGITIKRSNSSRKEATVEGWGLIEGMPTGRHFDRRVYDDVETDDISDSPDQLAKCYSKFDMSDNLGMDGGTHRVIGTFYSHLGPLIQIRDLIDPLTDEKKYSARIIPATDDGTINGKPIMLSQKRLDDLKLKQHFDSQQLCDPTPRETAPLHFEFITKATPKDIPPDIWRFMLIDPAGDLDTQKHAKDAWAFGVFGVRPSMDNLGTSDTYLLDLEVAPMGHSQSVDTAVRMYLRNGMIMQMGVEKVGQSTTEIHIANALRAHGRYVSVDAGTLVILKPSTKVPKSRRIMSALEWPLSNGRLHYSEAIRPEFIDRLQKEMDRFPVWHDDILDIWAYLYSTIILQYKFPLNTAAQSQKKRKLPQIGVV